MSLDEIRNLAKGLNGGEVVELHPEPRASLELTEDEIHEALDHLPHTCAAYQKLEQALAIESGPGGNFHHPEPAA